MKQQHHNHKHHRRRTKPPTSELVSDQSYYLAHDTCNSHIIYTHSHRRLRISSTTATPTKRIIDFISVLCILLLFAPFALVHLQPQQPTQLSSTTAQQQRNNYLLPGHNLENLRLPESLSVDSVVYQLKAFDESNPGRKFSYHLSGEYLKVDEDSGEVRLVKPLDREQQARFSAVVNVLDNGDFRSDTPLESRRRLIIVEDVDDSYPIFGAHKQSLVHNVLQSQYVYQVDVSERMQNNSIVLADLLATDADEGSNAEILFECRARQSTNSACEVFALDSRRLATGRYSISIRTKSQLDFERVQSYKLSLIARGRRSSPLKGVPLETEAIININVINVQDEWPVFMNAPYSLSMHEGLKPGTQLLNLFVQDGDAAPQRDLSMVVAPGPFSEYFQVTKSPESDKVWYLETNTTIDREMQPFSNLINGMFTITLLAAELDPTGSPVASEAELWNALHAPSYAKGTLRTENVTIVVFDLPDSRPVFLQASTGKPIKDNLLVVNVSESIVTGASVPNLDLAVQDMDQGINSRFKLSLMDSEVGPMSTNAFKLDSEIIYGKSEVVLTVVNSSLFDYEIPEYRIYKFSLVASKGDDPPIVQILEIQLNILDANDNIPEFERNQYVVDVPEDALPGHLVTTIKARDKDSGKFGLIDYSLRGFGAMKFNVDPREGKIVVNDCGVPHCLDYESQSSFSLTYEAKDRGGRMSNVSLIINVIDINDHAPKFVETVYKRELINDNLSTKNNYISPQLVVRAKDGDGPTQGKNNITYRIKSTNLTGLDIDPISGLVYISQPLDLDSVISGNQMDASSQQMNERSIVDRRLVFEAEVIASDNGTPPLNTTAKIILSLKGNREGAPMFKQDCYQAYVRENQPIGKPFFQVSAIDPDDKDSQLRYSIGYDLNDLVTINPITGELSFKTKVDFDDFSNVPYNITVHATDNSRPYPLRASTSVSVLIQDVNNKPPKFDEKEYRATLVQGRTRLNALVLQVNAVDLDRNALLNYSIITDQMYLIDRSGQQFTLDDLVNTSSGYLAQMSRQERNKLVTDLKKLFSINGRTGAIELKSEPDYSFASSITVVVKVADLNQETFLPSGETQQDFATCTFNLKAHVDKTPIFAPPWTIDRRDYNISILEESPIGTTVFSLLAKDPTTNNRVEAFEKIYETDPRDMFQVDRSGIVTINKRINYEELPNPKILPLSVKALTTDGEYSTANLIIHVVDLNDNAPIFKSHNYSAAISEASTHPQEILTVSAEDADSSSYSQIYYSLSGYSSDLFTIHPRKGVISVRRGAKLDRETEANHLLLATASDCNETLRVTDPSPKTTTIASDSFGCRKSSVFVHIMLTDENDNDPVFMSSNKRGEYNAIVSETATISSTVAHIVATDSDEGPNGKVGYEILRDESISRYLKIDQEGYISIVESLSGLGRVAPYKVTIRAFDYGKISRQSFVTLVLTISDVVANDGIPRFIQSKLDEVVMLSESSGPSTFVYQVQAIDPDEESNGKLMYKFSQPSDTFEIDPFTGVIKTQNRPNFYLDREQMPNYTLIIVAQDLGSPPKQVQQVLTIVISDINDNEPYFERAVDDPPMVLYVEEELPKDSLLGTVQAIDKDIGQNALIGYEIIEGNSDNLFRLSWDMPSDNSNSSSYGGDYKTNNLCRIYSNGRLDRETRDSYTLTIKASSMSKMRNPFMHQLKDPLGSRNPFNQYNASDLSKLRLILKLVDINDNKPVFINQNAKSVVDSSAEIYSQLMVMRAVDADSSDLDIQYSIVDALYYMDSKLRFGPGPISTDNKKYQYESNAVLGQPVSMKHVFDIDPRAGILRNSVSLRPYVDGYFEVFVKASSGSSRSDQLVSSVMEDGIDRVRSSNLCRAHADANNATTDKLTPSSNNISFNSNLPTSLSESLRENCSVGVTKAIVFVTHQRETFRFVFNKTKLSDRLDEFKLKVQNALEEILFEPAQAQASFAGPKGAYNSENHLQQQARAERVYLNTFSTDFYEREDGSLDFATLTSCSQLVRFDDHPNNQLEDSVAYAASNGPATGGSSSYVPNQIINYEDVLNLLKTLNATQMRQQKQSLFSQYGLVNIERCVPDKTVYKMSLPERLALYFAVMIALVSSFLAFVVSRMRKSYEKNLRLLQRSRYQYMGPYAALAPGLQASRQAPHHLSAGTLPGSLSNGFMGPIYGSHLDFDTSAAGQNPAFDTWQL